MWEAHVRSTGQPHSTGGEADIHARTLFAVERVNERALQTVCSRRFRLAMCNRAATMQAYSPVAFHDKQPNLHSH
jgi:hypothetical protein